MIDETLKELIAQEHLQIVCGASLSVCVLMLKSGHSVVGISPPLPVGGNTALACELARENAMKKLEELERYRLAHQRWEEQSGEG